MDAGPGVRTAVVTGASSGIGLETALGLARRRFSLALVARDEARGEAARREALAAGAPQALLFLANLASLAQVRRLASDLCTRLERIDVLVNNAGALHATRKLTVDGLEMNFAVNHLAPFLLTNLLLPRLLASAPARVRESDAASRSGSPRPVPTSFAPRAPPPTSRPPRRACGSADAARWPFRPTC